jgi:hypothetical protein
VREPPPEGSGKRPGASPPAASAARIDAGLSLRPLLASYASALIIVVASLAVGRAATRALGWRSTTWLEGAVGFALLVVIGSYSVRLLDGGTGSAIVLGLVILGAAAYLRFRIVPLEDLRLGALPAAAAAAVASLPFLANQRIGILGVGINNDLASHLLWAQWLRNQSDPIPVSLDNGYPIGPHSLAASLGQAFGFSMTHAIVGLLIAVATLTAITALSLLRDLPPARRTLAGALVALPYMAASAFAVGGFKETTIALIVLGFALALARLEAEFPGDRALWISLGVLGAGAIMVYSYPGLYWLVAAAGLLGVAGLARALRARDLRSALRRAAPAVGVPLAVLLLLGAAEYGRLVAFHDRSGVSTVISGDSKLRQAVSPLETLGAWPDSDFLAGTGGPHLYPLFGALGLLALVVAAVWWVRRGSLAVPLAVLGALVIYVGTLIGGGLYVQSKALAVPAPLVMLLIVRALLDVDWVAAASSPRWRPARLGLAGAFCLVAAYSSFVALRDAVVAGNSHADELASIRQRVGGDWTLSLTTDRYTDYQLRSTMVGSPARNAQLIIPSRAGKDYRLPLDFDSVWPETLDVFKWVLATRAPYRSRPPPNLKLVEQTDSYELYKRVGPTPLNQRVFGEEARPGKVLRCRAADLKIAGKRQLGRVATIFAPAPVIGKRRSWAPTNGLSPGQSATQELTLPPGNWELSIQYQSPVVGLTVRAAGESFPLPAAMDGAIPFRLGQGPFWRVGEISSDGGPVQIEVGADGLSTLQKLLGVGRRAAIGNVVATRTDPHREIPFRRACGTYVDHYTVDPAVVRAKAKHVARLRQISEGALNGHFVPEENTSKKAPATP